MPTPAFRGTDHLPASTILVPSGDYKSVDPTSVILEVGGVDAAQSSSLRVILDVTVASGGGGVTVTIEGYDEASGTYFTLLAGALVSTVVKNSYIVTPWFAAAANVSAQTVLVPQIRVKFVGSGTRTTLTYSATAVLSA